MAGSRPREDDADAINQKLARTLQDKATQHVAPITCCGCHSTAASTAASTAPLAYKWAKIRVTRRQQIAAKKGALPGTHISVEDPAQGAAGQQNVADTGDQERGSATLSISRQS